MTAEKPPETRSAAHLSRVRGWLRRHIRALINRVPESGDLHSDSLTQEVFERVLKYKKSVLTEIEQGGTATNYLKVVALRALADELRRRGTPVKGLDETLLDGSEEEGNSAQAGSQEHAYEFEKIREALRGFSRQVATGALVALEDSYRQISFQDRDHMVKAFALRELGESKTAISQKLPYGGTLESRRKRVGRLLGMLDEILRLYFRKA